MAGKLLSRYNLQKNWMEDELLDFDDILQDSDEGYTPRSNSPDLDATADEKVIKESALDAAHKLESQYERTCAIVSFMTVLTGS